MSSIIPANPFLHKLWDRETAFGTFVFSPDPAHTEIIGHAGFDFVLIDTEHASLNVDDAVRHVRAANAVGLSAVIRIGTDGLHNIGRLLDTGAQGVVLPHFGLDMAQTATAIGALRYAPDGSRPTCTGVRAAAYGLGSFSDYATRANDELMAIGLIEDASVVEQIDEVFASCDLNAVIPGPADLAASLGLPGQLNHPTVVAAVRRVVEAAKTTGRLRVGLYLVDPTAASSWKDLDVDFFVFSIDYRVLARGYEKGISDLRNAWGARPPEH